MPAVNLTLPKSMSLDRRKAVSDGVHQALVDDFGVPQNGRFHVVTAYDSESVYMDESFLGVSRGSDFTFVQIVVMDGHSDGQKRALMRSIRANLLAAADLKPEDLFLNIVETPKTNWFCLVK